MSNFPEFVFNQDPRQDMNNKKRYFEIDHAQKWRVADQNSLPHEKCYMCNKQTYSLILYERNEDKSLCNRELFEIKDEKFIE